MQPNKSIKYILGVEQLGLLHVSAVGLRLLCAVGLDPDPEISLVNVQASEGCVRYPSNLFIQDLSKT